MPNRTVTAITSPRYVMIDGKVVPYEQARVHVLAPAVKYSIGVFEGFCGYWNSRLDQLFTYRMQDHLRRLRASLDMAGLDFAGDTSALEDDVHTVIRANEYRQNVHMRLQVLLVADDGPPEATGPTLTSIAAVPVSPYFAQRMLRLGVCSWVRISERSVPPRMKSIANYHNGRLASIEARRNGYDAPLILNEWGRIAEGFGYNFFLVRHGRLVTPAITESVLEGITRDSILRIARETLGLDVEERPVDRTEIYSAEEAFVCGSAAEVTAIASVDGYRFGAGQMGPVTAELRRLYLASAIGECFVDWGWVSPVYTTSGEALLAGPAAAGVSGSGRRDPMECSARSGLTASDETLAKEGEQP